ncbi:MAG TPA: inositol monophosphatase [Firmicutes bacterium]|nr:inositol monophosphatase [Bacillota bacterium]
MGCGPILELEVRKLIEQATQIALNAGKILTAKLETGITIEHKGSIDLVTDADRASEEYIVEQLRRVFPHHGILGEEGARVEGTSDYLWLIDPIDGTTNFAHGFPYFSVSLGLMKGDDVVLGVVYNPMTDECFVAERGGGSFLNGQRVAVSTQATLQESLLTTGFPYDIATTTKDNMKSFALASKVSQGVRCLGSAALDLCQVASGRLEAFWERSLQPWDIAAGSLIVEEAGGQVTGCGGQTFSAMGHEVCATNSLIHDDLVKLLTEERG